jgi:ADP-ribosylglycohydrolase
VSRSKTIKRALATPRLTRPVTTSGQRCSPRTLAIAIAICCALVARDFAGVILAVNHDGDSASTGSIAGNLLGATD